MTISSLRLIALAGCLAWTVACSPADRSVSSGAGSAPDPEFKALIDSQYTAWSFHEGQGAQAVENAGTRYAKDAGLVFYDLAPMKYNGWDDYKTGVMKAVINDASSITLRPNDDLRVTRHGRVAWTTVTFHVAVQMKAGDIFETDGRHTAIWENRGDQWLIVHEHMSAPLAQAN